jgi:hypothetical protein
MAKLMMNVSSPLGAIAGKPLNPVSPIGAVIGEVPSLLLSKSEATNLSDPLHLFTPAPVSQVTVAPQPSAATPLAVDPNLQPFADANNAANAKARQAGSQAAGIASVLAPGGASATGTVLGG